MSATYRPCLTNSRYLVVKIIFALLLSFVILSNSFANRTYGPVKANDFLSKIVNKNYPDSPLTKQQIMVAILRDNPKAFRGGNIHFLRQGIILNLPNETDIATITSNDASALIAQHFVLFKKGETGNFKHEALSPAAPIKNESTKQESTSDEGKGTSAKSTHLKEATIEPSTQNTSESEVPTKLKIKIRKQVQTQTNKLKHVKSLESISNQQNKTLDTLDDQIRILEELLEQDQKKKKQFVSSINTETKVEPETTQSANNKEPASEQTGIIEDENATAENAMSSLESALSAPKVETETVIVEAPATTGDKNNQTTPPTAPQTTAPPQEASTTEIGIQETHAETTSVDPIEKNQSTLDTESSVASFIKKQNTPKLIALISAFIIGLFALSYLIWGRKTKQPEAVATVSNTQKTSTDTLFTDTSVEPSIQDTTTLLNPVIKKQSASDTASSPISDKNSEQDSEIKINMARAYMDMGYIDAAKESLEEVRKEGTAEQKETVEQMLSML